jgi:hypothetical protein
VHYFRTVGTQLPSLSGPSARARDNLRQLRYPLRKAWGAYQWRRIADVLGRSERCPGKLRTMAPLVGSASIADPTNLARELTEVLEIPLNARIVRGNADVTPFGPRVPERLRVRAKWAAARGRQSRK